MVRYQHWLTGSSSETNWLDYGSLPALALHPKQTGNRKENHCDSMVETLVGPGSFSSLICETHNSQLMDKGKRNAGTIFVWKSHEKYLLIGVGVSGRIILQ
jgi:hypothetical protein